MHPWYGAVIALPSSEHAQAVAAHPIAGKILSVPKQCGASLHRTISIFFVWNEATYLVIIIKFIIITQLCWFQRLQHWKTDKKGKFHLVGIGISTLYATSFRRRFFVDHHAVKDTPTNIILSWFSIPLALKWAAKILKISLQIKMSKTVFE